MNIWFLTVTLIRLAGATSASSTLVFFGGGEEDMYWKKKSCWEKNVNAEDSRKEKKPNKIISPFSLHRNSYSNKVWGYKLVLQWSIVSKSLRKVALLIRLEGFRMNRQTNIPIWKHQGLLRPLERASTRVRFLSLLTSHGISLYINVQRTSRLAETDNQNFKWKLLMALALILILQWITLFFP